MIDESEGDETYKRVAGAKLDALLGLCESAACRRVRLLAYFGEASEPCGNCDNCLAPPRTWDATDAARKALSCIYRSGQRFGVLHLIDVLRGRDTERVRRWRHEQLSVFGVGADLDEATWRSVFRQLVALGFVRVDHEAHGALKLTEASRPVLRGEQAVSLRSDVREKQSAPRNGRRRGVRDQGRVTGARPGDRGGLRSPGDADAAADTALLERLKAWRLAQTKAQSVPAYVILHDATLAEIVRLRPSTTQELALIPGIGAKKLERYGDELVALVAGSTASPGEAATADRSDVDADELGEAAGAG